MLAIIGEEFDRPALPLSSSLLPPLSPLSPSSYPLFPPHLLLPLLHTESDKGKFAKVSKHNLPPMASRVCFRSSLSHPPPLSSYLLPLFPPHLLLPLLHTESGKGKFANVSKHNLPPRASRVCFRSLSRNWFDRRCARTITAAEALMSFRFVQCARWNLERGVRERERERGEEGERERGERGRGEGERGGGRRGDNAPFTLLCLV